MSKLNHSRVVLKNIDFCAGQDRFSGASLNGSRKKTYTPEQVSESRWQFLLNCARAEVRGSKMPGAPKAMRQMLRCAKGMNETCVRAWISRQPDYAEAKEVVLSRESRRPTLPTSTS